MEKAKEKQKERNERGVRKWKIVLKVKDKKV